MMMKHDIRAGYQLVGIAILALCLTSPLRAQDTSAPANAKPFLTLDGKPPLVIGHRGLPGPDAGGNVGLL